MGYFDTYLDWVNSNYITDAEKEELLSFKDDEKEIENRFYAPLSFGTAGLRGIMGIGLNRMNIYTVRHATQGFASYIASLGEDAKDMGVAIAYDCRHMSREFAAEAAGVFAGNGIHVMLFDDMRPTPELSFAIRRLGCIAGVNITASHNTKEYNGYKAYRSDGSQISSDVADAVSAAIAECDMFEGIMRMSLEDAASSGLLTYLGENTDENFLEYCLSQAISPDCVKKAADSFKLIYTPFHGVGYKLVPEILTRLGMKHLLLEPKQIIPDGEFPTVKSPNPQDAEGFAGAIELAKLHDVDLIIGTDPDADRVGVVVRTGDDVYTALSGNQVGVLLLDYIIKARRESGTLPEKSAVLKSIVTTELAAAVAEKNGVLCCNTFTGFKYLAERISELESEGEYTYLLAFEESYGYLVGNGVRDKDAVTASMLICEMAAWYHLRGMTVCDAMEAIYREYGYYLDETENYVMKGVDGLERMEALMRSLRQTPPSSFGGTEVVRYRDYLDGTVRLCSGEIIGNTEISGSDVLYFELSDGSCVVVRPSGTEPKVRVYILAKAACREVCENKIAACKQTARSLIDG